MNRGLKIRLYPSAQQKRMICSTAGACRYVYNKGLEWKEAAFKADGTVLTYSDLAGALVQMKRSLSWLKEAESSSLQQSLRALFRAYDNFFGNPKKYGRPRFKSKRRGAASYTMPLNNGNIRILDERTVKLPKLGRVKARVHRFPGKGWILKSVTISAESDGAFYASFLYKCPDSALLNRCLSYCRKLGITGRAIGLDYKSDGLYMDSNGHVCGSPKYYRRYEKKLAKAQRRLSRKQGARRGETPSNNYRRQQRKLSKIHKKIRDSRKDYLHKESRRIANSCEIVCVEDLDMRIMSNRGFRNGKATLDNGWGMFLTMLEYKLAEQHGCLVKISRWYPSSQRCCACGRIENSLKDLSIRTWTCPACGSRHDRDVNAARNILNEGLRLLKEEAA